MFPARPLALCLLLLLAGCTLEPFQTAPPPSRHPGASAPQGRVPGSAPSLPSTESPAHAPSPETGTEVPAVAAPPKERPKTAPATLGPASRALVSQAQVQRSKGDLPGATVSLERALRIEPNNPLLWIEMGRLRMDQHNFQQAEAMGRRALSMAIGDAHTQSAAWQLIAESFRARGMNPQAQDALEKSRELSHL